MQNLIPHFKYSTTRSSIKKQLGHIAADGVVLLWLESLDEFYKALGYTVSMAKAGIMPDEFIWDEYVKDGAVNSTACLQMHIIEYLSKHSSSFRKKYGEQYENWIAAFDGELKKKDERCSSCSMNPFCKDL
jgi:hypothetical protein